MLPVRALLEQIAARQQRIDEHLAAEISGQVERLLQPILSQLTAQRTAPVQEWFSIADTAVMTGLSEDHVRRHVTAGLLPVVNQGTFDKPLYRVHRRDIDEWMAKRREAPLPARRKAKSAQTGSYRSRHHAPKG